MQWLRKIISLSLAIALGAMTVSAEPAKALAMARGSMKINGAAAPASTAIFAGDRIDVGSGSATLSGQVGTVMLAANTAAQLDANRLVLRQGAAAVNTVSGLSVRIGEMEITPATPAARFEVLRSGANVTVAARTGNLMIRSAGQNTVLAQGNAAKFGSVPRKFAMDDDDDQKWALILIFAATATAVVVGLAGDDEIPVSPAIP